MNLVEKYKKLDNWMWRKFDWVIVATLRWVAYAVLIIGLVTFNTQLIIAGALIWLAWALNINASALQINHSLSKQNLEMTQKQWDHYEEFTCPVHSKKKDKKK